MACLDLSITLQNLSGLATEAVRDYLKRRRVRPEVLDHLERSINENEALGKLLAGKGRCHSKPRRSTGNPIRVELGMANSLLV